MERLTQDQRRSLDRYIQDREQRELAVAQALLGAAQNGP
jgi:hypothetical protein